MSNSNHFLPSTPSIHIAGRLSLSMKGMLWREALQFQQLPAIRFALHLHRCQTPDLDLAWAVKNVIKTSVLHFV
jgi:hypothetical protein